MKVMALIAMVLPVWYWLQTKTFNVFLVVLGVILGFMAFFPWHTFMRERRW